MVRMRRWRNLLSGPRGGGRGISETTKKRKVTEQESEAKEWEVKLRYQEEGPQRKKAPSWQIS